MVAKDRDCGQCMFKVVDLFCGTGALSYGLALGDERFHVVAGIDHDADACETARANHPNAKILCRSIRDISAAEFASEAELDGVDVIVGGPPCQGFSSLRPNRNSNKDDHRNYLYLDFVEYVEFFRPKVFLMENVVGLIGETKGDLLNDIMRDFGNINFDVDFRILNAAHYGVPQKRERLIMVGVNKDIIASPSLNFPDPTHFFKGRVIGTQRKDKYITNADHGCRAITVMEAISDLPELSSGQSSDLYAGPPGNAYQEVMRARGSSRVSLHQAASHSKKMLDIIKVSGTSKSALPKGLVSSGFSSCYSRMEADQPATTITVKFTSPASSKCIHPHQHRAITPREAARLQSFPDCFQFRGSKTAIASQLGNAVPPLLSKAIAEMLVKNLEAGIDAR
jgi:DNA (cytosine-5)-methyltransferase 1